MLVKPKTLLCILGPTAVGKTATAISLAKRLNTEIISADSRQFYSELSIGTAKPSPSELASVPHHFIGHIGINQTYSAGDFERDALACLNKLFETHDTVVAVGGSGLYVKALVDGLDDMPKANEALRTELNSLHHSHGISILQERLHQIDQELYEKTELQNPQRVMRAIEIAIATKEGFIPNKNKHLRTFNVVKVVINLPREVLYQRINQRVDEMISLGLVEEAKHFLSYKNHYALQTVGYTELFDYFEHKHSLDEAINLIKQHTRNYAKRQLTWFKKEAPENWMLPLEVDAILSLLD